LLNSFTPVTRDEQIIMTGKRTGATLHQVDAVVQRHGIRRKQQLSHAEYLASTIRTRQRPNGDYDGGRHRNDGDDHHTWHWQVQHLL